MRQIMQTAFKVIASSKWDGSSNTIRYFSEEAKAKKFVNKFKKDKIFKEQWSTPRVEKIYLDLEF